MKSTALSLKWRDAGQAIVLIVIGNVLAFIMSIAGDKLPTLAEMGSNLIISLKFAVIPYILKNFFTNDVAVAEKTISEAKAEAKK